VSAVPRTRRSTSNGAAAAQGRSRLPYLLGRVDRGVRAELQERLRAYGLSVPEYTTLSVLQTRPGLSNAQLARRSLITPQSMNQVVAALERRGLIERTPDPAHQRILRTTLTRAGEKLLDELAGMVTALEDEILADLSPEQRNALVEGLRSCMRRLAAGIDMHH
jgi:DNA-binding MarR family transcriptional regulator